MNEHTHNHALEEKKPSPWGRVAGILFALSGIAIIPNGYLSSIGFWIIDIPFFLTAFFLIKNNRGKGLLIATGLLATLPISSYFYYYIIPLPISMALRILSALTPIVKDILHTKEKQPSALTIPICAPFAIPLLCPTNPPVLTRIALKAAKH